MDTETIASFNNIKRKEKKKSYILIQQSHTKSMMIKTNLPIQNNDKEKKMLAFGKECNDLGILLGGGGTQCRDSIKIPCA